MFRLLCEQSGLPIPTAEHVFAPPRRWRFDYAWPEDRVALEVEGGVWISGRHTRGSGFVKDLEKYSEAAARGWLTVRVTPQQLLTPATVELVRRAIGSRAP